MDQFLSNLCWSWKGPIFMDILLYRYESKYSICLPSASMHIWSLFRNDTTAFLMDLIGRSFHIWRRTALSSSLLVGFGVNFWYIWSIAPQTQKSKGFKSGEFGGHSSLSIKSGHSSESNSCVRRTVWAGAPSCWKMNLSFINNSQSSIRLGRRLVR